MSTDLPPISVLVEGPLDRVVAQCILKRIDLPLDRVYGEKGKSHLLRILRNHNQAAEFHPRFVLVDLDNDTDCAPDFVQQALPNPARRMCFRVVVRAVEAWLMADSENLGEFLGVSSNRFPTLPDTVENPKRLLVDIVRARCKRPSIKRAIVPREGSGAAVGEEYNMTLTDFLLTSDTPWRLEVAIQHSDSLRRCVQALNIITPRKWTTS